MLENGTTIPCAGSGVMGMGATAVDVLVIFEIYIHIIDDPIAMTTIVIYILAESSTYALVSAITFVLCIVI